MEIQASFGLTLSGERMTIRIEGNSCTGCGNCALVCPSDVIRIDEVMQQASAAYNADCTSCRLCILHCPFHCIEVPSRMRSSSENFALKQYLIGLGLRPDDRA